MKHSELDEAVDEKSALLNELAGMLDRYFAFDEYGRLAVEVARDEAGTLLVKDVVVDQLTGDEAAVERAFQSAELQTFVPALARAVETLCLLDSADLALVGGGTFVHVPPDDHPSRPRVAFLAGLIRAPSLSFDARRDESLAAMRARGAELEASVGLSGSAAAATDMVAGTVVFSTDGVDLASARQVVIGSFSRAHRSWVWGGDNPSLSPEARKRCKALLDSLPDRAPWEITTPGFPTDEPTAWALAAWVAHLGGLEGTFRVAAGSSGFVVLGLSGVERTRGA